MKRGRQIVFTRHRRSSKKSVLQLSLVLYVWCVVHVPYVMYVLHLPYVVYQVRVLCVACYACVVCAVCAVCAVFALCDAWGALVCGVCDEVCAVCCMLCRLCRTSSTGRRHKGATPSWTVGRSCPSCRRTRATTCRKSVTWSCTMETVTRSRWMLRYVAAFLYDCTVITWY